MSHYEKSGPKVDKRDTAEAQDVKRIICNCIEAHRMKNYITLLNESQNALSSGADSAPQVERTLSITYSSSLIETLHI